MKPVAMTPASQPDAAAVLVPVGNVATMQARGWQVVPDENTQPVTPTKPDEDTDNG